MLQEEQGALKLAETIEATMKDPEKAAKLIDEKTGTKGIIETIIAFIKDYMNRVPGQSDEDWIKEQYAKPQYAKAWKNGGKERAAQILVNDVKDYENAKKSLKSHIDLGGTRTSWLAEQIEIGADNNGKDPAEYAREISDGLKEAKKENRDFLLGSDMMREAK